MKSFLLIGLGRFGSALATELCELGNEVLAVDAHEELVQAVAPKVTHAVTADARDPEVLKELSAHSFDCAVVAVGSDIGTSALITLNLKEQGVARVVAKASSHTHKKVLEKIGADRVVFPEYEMGVKLAHALSESNVLNFIELSEDASIVEIPVPAAWVNKTLRQLDVRNTYGVNIIALRRGPKQKFMISPGGEDVLESTDVVVALGPDKNINRVQKL